MGIPITLRLDDAAVIRLDAVAAGRSMSREQVLETALADYLEFEAEQLDMIREGIEAADQGDFASPDEVDEVFAKYRDA